MKTSLWLLLVYIVSSLSAMLSVVLQLSLLGESLYKDLACSTSTSPMSLTIPVFHKSHSLADFVKISGVLFEHVCSGALVADY